MDNRAKIFMAFSPLKGYYDMVDEVNIVREDKIELYDDEADKINKTLNKLKKGMIVEVKYYRNNAYVNEVSKIESLCNESRELILNKITVKFNDIIDIKIKEDNYFI